MAYRYKQHWIATNLTLMIIGRREIYEDDDFWADHDDLCHGDPASFEDDPDYAEGFIWSCCKKLGDDEGCKTTKHRAQMNVILDDVPNAANKRKAEGELQKPLYKRWRY